MSSSQIISIRITQKLQEKLDYLATVTKRSKSWHVQKALREYIEVQAWQAKEIQKAIKEADEGKFATDEEVNAMFAELKDEKYLTRLLSERKKKTH